MRDYNLVMVRGDTLSFGVELEDNDGNPFEQDLDTAFFTCKAGYDETRLLFQKKLGSGISKVGTGQYVVRVAPEDTKNLQAGKYWYDFELGTNGDVFTFLKGILDIESDVTIH